MRAQHGTQRRNAELTTQHYDRTQGGNMATKNSWLEIDREGLRKSLAQKDKFFLLTEMVANAWDANVSGSP